MPGIPCGGEKASWDANFGAHQCDQPVLEADEDSQGQRVLGLWDCRCAAENWEKGEAAKSKAALSLLPQLVLGLPGSHSGQVPRASPTAHGGERSKELFFGDSCLGSQGKASSSVSRQQGDGNSRQQ